MKTSLMGLCLLASLEASAKDYYLAPGGTGNGMTIDKPFGDPIKAFAAPVSYTHLTLPTTVPV